MPKDRPSEAWLPAALVEALVDLYRPPGSVPPEVDERIAAMAWQECDGIKARRRVRRWGIIGAVAAIILGAVWIRDVVLRAPQPLMLSVDPLAGAEDIDRNGRVDIIDAFRLARAIEEDAGLDPGWDVNRDGLVNHADVDTVAMSAVRLTGGPG